MDEGNVVVQDGGGGASTTEVEKRLPEGDGISVGNKEDGDEPVELKRQIGLVGCIAFVVGTVIGSGIFISPKGVLQNTGSVGLSLVVWVACGILSTIGALCYAELGTCITKSGGDFTYILESFGPVPAFLRVWTLLVAVRTASFAVLVITAATYLIQPFFGDCGVPTSVIQLLGATLLAAVFCLNSVSVAWSNRVQIIFSIAKVLGLVIIILSGMVLMIQGNVENLKDGFTPAIEVSASDIPLAFYSGLFAYSGWQFLPSFTEEIINPARNIPIGIVVSMTIITGVYIMANLAYFVVLTPTELLASEAVALVVLVFTETGLLIMMIKVELWCVLKTREMEWETLEGWVLQQTYQTFAERVLGPWSVIISLAVAMSCIGSLNGALFSFARIMMVSSREGMTPQVLGMIHVEYKSPLPAAVVSFPIVIAMLMSPDINTLINYLSFTRWLFISIAVASIPYFRWKYPDMPRPFKVPIILPIIFIMCALFVVVVSIYSSPIDCGIGAAITVTGIPVYYFFVWWENKPVWFTDAMDSISCFLQRFLYIAPGAKKTD